MQFAIILDKSKQSILAKHSSLAQKKWFSHECALETLRQKDTHFEWESVITIALIIHLKLQMERKWFPSLPCVCRGALSWLSSDCSIFLKKKQGRRRILKSSPVSDRSKNASYYKDKPTNLH